MVAFTSPNTNGTDTEYYPSSSLSPVFSNQANTFNADDDASVHLPDAAVAKTAATGVTETGNSATSQAVVGETVDYSYSVTIAAGTTVYNGVLKDSLPTGLIQNGTATATFDGDPLPGTFTLDADGTLHFPDTYNNTTTSNQVFTVTLPTLVDPAGTYAHLSDPANRPASQTVTNTATFTSNFTDGGDPVTPRTKNNTVTVVSPNPSLTKAASKDQVLPDDTVTFTLTASNASSRPAAHDAVVVDCLPGGFGSPVYTTPLPSGVTTVPAVVGDGTNGCDSDHTVLRWNVGSIDGGSSVELKYTAVVVAPAVGAAAYQNTATLTSSSLDDSANDPATERVYTNTANHTATVIGATTDKSVSPAKATSGEEVTYTVAVTLPAQVQFYSAAVIDTLPTGITVPTPTTAQVSCETAETTPADCAADLTGLATLTTSGTTVGWMLGDIAAAAYDRVVTVEYTTTVDDASTNTVGKTRVNTAGLKWFSDHQASPPTAANATFGVTGGTDTATVTVKQPELTLAKKVTDLSNVAITGAQPTDTFKYTVTVTNKNGTNNSDAFDVTVTDVVPEGVVVDESSLPVGATLAGEDATNGGGTITWTIATIAKGATATLTYQATLAPSVSLDGSALTNTAKVTTYASYTTGPFRTFTVGAKTSTITPAFPHIALTKTAPTGPSYVGASRTWTFTAENTGDGTAKDVVLTDVLPANWEYDADSASYKLNGGTTAVDFEPAVSTASGVQTLTFPTLSTVDAGDSYVVTYTAKPTTAALTTPGVGSTTHHTNTVSATAKDLSGSSVYDTDKTFVGADATAYTTIDSADLTLTKAAGSDLVAGKTTSDAWTITVKNTSTTDTAVGPFTVTDTPGTLPTGITVSSATGTGWSCTTPDTTTGDFTCTRTDATDTLAHGASFPAIKVAVAVAADVASGTDVANTASVEGKTYDPDTSNNEASKTISTVTSADLKITKAVTGTLKAGTTGTWTITVDNLGPSVSKGPIKITDTLPTSGLSDITIDGTDWSCGTVTTSVVCTYAGDLAVGTAPVITVKGTIAASFTGDMTNKADITSVTTTDPVSTNDSSTSTETVDTETTLGLAKTLKTSPLVPGNNAVYGFTVTNSGDADARNVTIVDELPGGLTYVSSSDVTGTWSCAGVVDTGVTTVTCTLSGTLGTGTSNKAAVDITVGVPSSLTGSITNTGTVSADNADDEDGSTPASGTTGEADLGVTKTHPTGAILAGDSVSYTVTVTNYGPTDAPVGTTVVDTVPSGLTPVSASGTGWSCAAPVGQKITCTSTAILESGDSASAITVLVDVPAATTAGTYTNSVTVTGTLDEPSTATHDNTATDDTVITTDADLTIVKAVTSGATVVAGTNATYTLTVTNAGPSNAASVKVVDTLPTGMTGVSISGTGFTCVLSSMTCTMTTMAPGTSVITVKALVASSVADATVLTNTSDLTWTDSSGSRSDSDTEDVTVEAEADLVLEKTAEETTLDAGELASFDLVVTNEGDSDTVGPTTIVDTLPIGMSYDSAVSTDWSCTAATFDPLIAQEVTCTLAAGVPAGGTAAALTIVVATDPTLGTVTLTNSATVSTTTTDVDLTNNTDTADTGFGQSADLTVAKTHSGTGRIGDTVSFTITVTNDGGPSVAEGVAVTDSLPAELDYVDAAGSDPAWSCDPAVPNATTGGVDVSCAYADPLAPGATTPVLVITASVTVAAYPSVDNDVTVSATTPDPDMTNNSATDTLEVDPLVDLSIAKTHTGTVQVDDTAVYVITVANSGPTEAPAGVTITDQLPDGLSYLSSDAPDASCADTSGTVVCTLTAALATGASASVILNVTVHEAAYPEIVNEATVATLHENLGTHPDTASDTAEVLPAPALPHSGLDVPGGKLIALSLLLVLGGAALILYDRRRRA